MTAVRHILFGLLFIFGLAELRFGAGEVHAGDLRSGKPSSVAAVELAPCSDGLATARTAIIVTNDPIPDRLPPERENDAVAVPPLRGHIDVRFAEARQAIADRAFGRSPIHGFNSRAPPAFS